MKYLSFFCFLSMFSIIHFLKAIHFFFLQASFENDNLILEWKCFSGEESLFILSYRHENDEKCQTVSLNMDWKNNNSFDNRTEYFLPNIKPGRYICHIQTKCEFGVSEMSNGITVWKENEVNFNNSFFFLSSILITCLKACNHEVILL